MSCTSSAGAGWRGLTGMSVFPSIASAIALGLCRRVEALQHGSCHVFERGTTGIDLPYQTQPLKAGRQEARQCANVDVRGKLPACHGAHQCGTECRLCLREPLPHARQGCAVAARQFGGTIAEKAAAPSRPGNDLLNELPSERRESFAHRHRLRQDCGNVRRPADRKSTRLNSSHVEISYAVFCLKKKKKKHQDAFLKKKKKTKQ